jgi:hypothetical protein
MRGLTEEKALDVFTEGLDLKNGRGNWTAIGLFLAYLKLWPKSLIARSES